MTELLKHVGNGVPQLKQWILYHLLHGTTHILHGSG